MAPSLSVTALITLVVSTWSYKDCGDLKIICNRKDPMCCEGSCCPLLDHFQFISPSTPDNGPFPTPEPTPSRSCPNVGDQCSSAKPRGEECCAGSGTRCQFTGSDVDGNLFGTCCFPKDTKGCTVDSDCCGMDNKCLANMCLSSKVADAIGARYVSYQGERAASSNVAAAAAAQAASAQTVHMNHFSVDSIAENQSESHQHSKWRHVEIFAVTILTITAVLVIIGYSPILCRRLKIKRSMQEVEHLSVATMSITETDEDAQDDVEEELKL